MTNKEEPYVGRELSSSSKDGDTGNAFEPGHEQGTPSNEPLQAMIEASEDLLGNLADAEEDIRPDGQLRPDVRRLSATIAYAKQQQQHSSLPKYSYTVCIATIQTLNGEVEFQSDHALTDEEIAEKASDLANDTDMHWERGDIDPEFDIEEVQKWVRIEG